MIARGANVPHDDRNLLAMGRYDGRGKSAGLMGRDDQRADPVVNKSEAAGNLFLRRSLAVLRQQFGETVFFHFLFDTPHISLPVRVLSGLNAVPERERRL